MKEMSKKIHRKMATMLTVCMLTTAIVPLSGYAKVYEEVPISNNSLELPNLATMPNAEVRVWFPENTYEMVIDELKEEKEFNFNVSVDFEKFASPANASPFDWDAEAWGAQIASELGFEATIDESSLWLSDRIGLKVGVSTNPYAIIAKATTPENMKFMEKYRIRVNLKALTDDVTYPELLEIPDVSIDLIISGSGPNRDICIPAENLIWRDKKPGWVGWDQNTLTEEEKDRVKYTAVRLYRDGELQIPNKMVTSRGYFTWFDVRQFFTEPGEYVFQACFIMQNGWDVPEEYWIEESIPYNFVLPDKSVSAPINLTWSSDGTAKWDKSPEEDLIDYGTAQRYLIYLYEKNEESGEYEQLGTFYKGKENKMDVGSALMADKTYKFRVMALGDLTEYANSTLSEFSEEFKLNPVAQEGNALINDLLNSADIKASVEQTTLTEQDKETLKLAVQVYENVAENYAELEEAYREESGKEALSVETGESGVDAEKVTVIGGILNGATGIKFDKPEPEDLNHANVSMYGRKSAVNITLSGEVSGELKYPVLITMPIPPGIDGEDLIIIHVKHDGSVERIKPRINEDGTASFAVTEFSTFFFVDSTSTSGGSSGGSGGSSGGSGGGSASLSGTVTTDSKKGQVHSVKGIITGSGDGYSKWISETTQEGTETRWKLQYADGTFAAGSYVTDEQGNQVKDAAGNLVEQPLWELVDGAWYAFGTDGYVKTGLIFDPALNGWFYVDVNAGMRTGWQQIDGKWHYFNPSPDGIQGKMAVSITVDGYMIDENGVWIQH